MWKDATDSYFETYRSDVANHLLALIYDSLWELLFFLMYVDIKFWQFKTKTIFSFAREIIMQKKSWILCKGKEPAE